MDPSPTKAYMIHHREDLDVEPLYDLAFGKRPREELYDLRTDPHYMRTLGKPICDLHLYLCAVLPGCYASYNMCENFAH